MNLDETVEKWVQEDIGSVNIVPDKRKTSGTDGVINGYEYTWRLNAYPEENKEEVYSEHIQSGNNYLIFGGLLNFLRGEPKKPEEDQFFRDKAEQRAEELAEEIQDYGIDTSIDYRSFEDPEVNFPCRVPKPRS